MPGVSKDIRAVPIPPITWEPTNRLQSLQELAKHATERAQAATEWYLRAKGGARRSARMLRLLAIILTAAAGILPIVQQIYVTADGRPALSPAWASVLIALAVVLIGLDRFFGFSSAWLRYVTADLQIRQVRETFELDWQATCASFAEQAPTDEQLRSAILLIRGFVEQVNTIVSTETARWVAEFQEALRRAEEEARSSPPITQTGSATIKVENGAVVDLPGWSLIVDRGTVRNYSGETAALSDLSPGDHVLRFSGAISGRAARAETLVSIRPGAITNVSVTLA